ncbi:MAG: helix-turn-helix transcriptional regulator [Dethiobacter sp.]|nr:helix-turn-helix transcriptional regulator [Dethiobacter sp.]MCL5982365.1 helix-turn-helix domain-containing protein [Bacillota bacterium]
MSHFHQKLRVLRKSRRLSQKQLADLSGVSPSYLSRVERGERNPPHPAVLKKMALPLNLSEYEILVLAGYLSEERERDTAPTPVHWQELVADPALNEAVQQLGSLTDEEKSSLQIYLHAIKLQRNKGKK